MQDAMASLSIAEFIAPRVPVASPLFTYMAYDKAKPFKLPEFRRSRGGSATQLDTGGTAVDKQLDSYAYDYPIDKHIIQGSTEQQANFTRQKINTTAQIGSMAWAVNVLDLVASTVGAGTTFDISSSSTDVIDGLDGYILDLVKASMCGDMCRVKAVFGPTAWKKVKNHASVKDRFYTASGNKKGNPTDADVMDMIVTKPQSKITYLTVNGAAEGATSVPTFKLGSQILLFVCSDTPSDMDPSFMKTFHTNQLMQLGSYESPATRSTVLTVDVQAVAAVTNSTGAVILNV